MYFFCSGQYHRNHWKRSALNRLERPVPPDFEEQQNIMRWQTKNYTFLLVYTGMSAGLYVHCFTLICMRNHNVPWFTLVSIWNHMFLGLH